MEEILLAMHSSESDLYNLQHDYICDFNALLLIDTYLSNEDKILRLNDKELEDYVLELCPKTGGSFWNTRLITSNWSQLMVKTKNSLLAWKLYTIARKYNIITECDIASSYNSIVKLLKPYMYLDARGLTYYLKKHRVNERTLRYILSTAVLQNTKNLVKTLIDTKLYSIEQLYIIFDTEQSLRLLYEYLAQTPACFEQAIEQGNYLFAIYLLDEKKCNISCTQVVEICKNSVNKKEVKDCFKRYTCTNHIMPIKLCSEWRAI